jgi:predicted nucleic acid-binding protein
LYANESKTAGGYTAKATNSSAVGKYQHLWDTHGVRQGNQKISEIERVTGVKSEQEYLNNPEAQEKYQLHLISQYVNNISSLRSTFDVPNDTPDEALMALQHFR